MTQDPAIIVRDLWKTFEVTADRRSTAKERFVRGKSRSKRTFTALENVSFEVPRGSTFGLVGHNGSGKSTMLKILAGVYRQSSGTALVSGRVDALLELGAGFHGELTGRENIYLNGAILGRTKKQIEESVDWIIDFADIGDFIDVPVKIYSSGMTVRLGFAAAVAVDPEILIVDEIIAVGDEDFQRKCFDHLYELRRKGTTIALVTHSLALARELCDEAVWLDHGKMQMIGEVDDVVTSYIARVNEIENDRRQSTKEPGNANADLGAIRQGSGEARMTSVELFDAEGNEVNFVHPGQDVTIRINITSRTELRNVEVGLAIVHESGLFLAGPNSRIGGVLYTIPEGESFVDFRINPLIIQPGTYSISTALLDGGHTYDYSDREAEFIVRSDSVGDEVGLVKVTGDWSPAISTALRGKKEA
ncbi:MAG: ABC transporter ATP-binding protein [Trueperella sp.]|uniref:ABC transporter ATP-binding protein n=1 Tax=Trueperella sp. TaxID=2699835 RepID=UPI0025E7E6CB|nr:ABC transporter ATP-binding protein [Trueperella sp.]MCI7306553.1 ABC transporter ATP-binding protein [Trueperella sp.]